MTILLTPSADVRRVKSSYANHLYRKRLPNSSGILLFSDLSKGVSSCDMNDSGDDKAGKNG
jgi:hypothetical protein